LLDFNSNNGAQEESQCILYANYGNPVNLQLAHHGAYAMALLQQDGDGHTRGRAGAAGGAGDEDGFLGNDVQLSLIRVWWLLSTFYVHLA
jgi:hypothetical protein